MSKIKRVLCFVMLVVTLTGSLFIGGCKNSGSSLPHVTQFKYEDIRQNEYLFGMGNLTSDMLPGIIDSGVTNGWSADKMGALGVKNTRIWMYVKYFVNRNDNDNGLYYIESNCAILQDYIDKLKAQGVERIVAMVCNFISPYEFNNSDSEALPSPYDDFEMYEKFLQIQENAYTMLAKKFPDIAFWEIGNEPDITHGSWFHKKGYLGGAGDNVNAPYKFTLDEVAYITADLCYYANRGIKAGNPNAKTVLPGLMDMPVHTAEVLDKIYGYIESGYLPSLEEYSDKNADNYFQVLAWHPYPRNAQDFIKQEKEIYQVAINHGDGGKPVFYTEFGFSDTDFADDSQRSANLAIECLTAIKNELNFVETAFLFRLSNLYEFARPDAPREMNFGMFYSPNDIENASQPKPIAFAIKKFFYGENADLSNLYIHTNSQA